MNDNKTKGRYAGTALALLLLCGLNYGLHRSQFYWLLAGFLPLFVGYAWVLRNEPKSSLRFYQWSGVVLRLALLFSVPNLSDDVYRFIWDGRLLAQGINPFAQLPAELMNGTMPPPPGLTNTLFSQLNSPEYFTIYPPLAQFTFWLSALLFPGSVYGATLLMKTSIFAAECGTIFLLPKLLHKWNFNPFNSLIYILNPLIILEISGNLHHEGLMVFFLLLALWWLDDRRWWLSPLAMAFSICAKLLPLMFLPLLLRRMGWKRAFVYYALTGISCLLLFIPLLDWSFIQGFSNSLDLYFRRFEFNASLYYLIRWWGYQEYGYNIIQTVGPRLAMLVLAGVLLITFFDKNKKTESLPGRMLLVITLYLFLATTVHPWYVSLPLLLCTFTNFRYPVLWSGLIFLTYINYSYGEYHENLWMVGLEYLGVFGFLMYEKIVKSF